MNSHCEICDVEQQCGYEYKPCDCCNYRKFKPKKGDDKCKSASDAQTQPRCRVVSIADALSRRQAQ